MSAATNACRFSWARNWWRRSAIAPDIWQIGATPPLPELMVLGELAQAAADGRSDIGLDEVGQLFASRFVEVVSGRPRETAPAADRAIAAARWKPRCGSMRIRTGEIDLEAAAARPASARSISCGCSQACSASPRTNTWCARGCAMRRVCWPTTTCPITDIAYDVGFGDLSNFVRTFHRAAGVSPLQVPAGLARDAQDFPRTARLH